MFESATIRLGRAWQDNFSLPFDGDSVEEFRNSMKTAETKRVVRPVKNQGVCCAVIAALLLPFVINAQPAVNTTVPTAGIQTLQGHVPEAIKKLKLRPIERYAAASRMHLAIGLPMRDQNGLNNFLRDVYNPASPNYHHYLKPSEFTERFG